MPGTGDLALVENVRMAYLPFLSSCLPVPRGYTVQLRIGIKGRSDGVDVFS